MRWIYNFGFFLFALFSLPHFLKRLRQADDPVRSVKERLGIFPVETASRFRTRHPVWVHAVSVGEVLAVEKFLHLLLKERPELQVVLTTVTPTGQRIAKSWENGRLSVFYFPFDFRFAVRRFFQTFKPKLLLLVETEIWPNVIREARTRGIPVGIVNGRLSERSFRAFKRFRWIFAPVFKTVTLFLVQTEKNRARWVELGVSPEKVTVTGNMKLDALDWDGSWEKEREPLREAWGIQPADQVLMGGSTHPGEDEMLLRVLRLFREERIPLKLVLAPRHVERSRRILEEVEREGFRGILMSEAAPPPPSYDVLILDKLGELRKLYLAADIVVMGGSFVPHGGQNPAEPAVTGRALLHGPWVNNFEELYQRLDEAGGSLRTDGEPQLILALKRILPNRAERQTMGRRAFEVLEKLRGAAERNLHFIEPFLKSTKGVPAHVG